MQGLLQGQACATSVNLNTVEPAHLRLSSSSHGSELPQVGLLVQEMDNRLGLLGDWPEDP